MDQMPSKAINISKKVKENSRCNDLAAKRND
jgi:hypothetical protein